MNETKSFWNWLGLPNRSDVLALQDLLQTQSEQLARMETENQRLSTLLERTKQRVGLLQNALIFREKRIVEKTGQEVREQVQASVAEITRKLGEAQEQTAAQMEKLSFAEGKTYDALMKSAENQDELLRIFIVNTLQKELEATLDSGLSQKAQTSKGKSKRKV